MTDLEVAQQIYLKHLINAGCKIVFATEIYGKEYVWMKDPAGTLFLERV